MRRVAAKISQKLRLRQVEDTRNIVEVNQAHLTHIVEQLASLGRNNTETQTSIKLAVGRNELRMLRHLNIRDINKNEFQVFSQWGEDGIIQFLISSIPIASKRFIEFGVEDYKESNSRFLLMNDNWSGLVFDGDKENIKKIIHSDLYWRYDITAKNAFISRENINELIKAAGFDGDIGVLSIDIDGNDYWVWEAIDCVNPAIVIVEYNHRFGPTELHTVPYDPAFVRSKAHYSMIYAGASLALLTELGKKKGYDLVGTASNGNNAFFVKKNLRPKELKKMTPQQAFHEGKFREARNKQGLLSYIPLEEERKILESLHTVNPLVKLPKRQGK